MSLYDTIEVRDRSKLPTPQPSWLFDGLDRGDHFQTKSLECNMAHYAIDHEGYLWQTDGGAFGDDEPTPTRTTYTGQIVFYTGAFSSRVPPEMEGKSRHSPWYEVVVLFVKGQATHWELVESRESHELIEE